MRSAPWMSVGKRNENRFLKVARDSLAFSFVGFNCYPECEPSKEPMPWSEAILFPCGYFCSSFDGISKVLCPTPVVGPSVWMLLLSLLHVLLVSVGLHIVILCKLLSWQNHFRPGSSISVCFLWVDIKQNAKLFSRASCSPALFCFAEDDRGANAFHLLCTVASMQVQSHCEWQFSSKAIPG